MNIDTRAEECVNLIRGHLHAFQNKQVVNERQVPSCGKAGAVGQAGSHQATVKAQARGAVGHASDRDAVSNQLFANTTKATACTRGNLGARHTLAASDGEQLVIGQLCDKVFYARSAVADVHKLDALLMERQALGTIVKDALCEVIGARGYSLIHKAAVLIGTHALKCNGGCKCFGTLLYYALLNGECALCLCIADIGTYIDEVLTAL